MKYEEIISKVEDGEKFFTNLEKRTFRLDGKLIDLQEIEMPECSTDAMTVIESLYESYKHSIPSERSESHRRKYFCALPEKELSDNDMLYGERRETARCRLELFVLMAIVDGRLTWRDEWGTWFWQSPHDKDLIIFRQWIGGEPEQDRA